MRAFGVAFQTAPGAAKPPAYPFPTMRRACRLALFPTRAKMETSSSADALRFRCEQLWIGRV